MRFAGLIFVATALMAADKDYNGRWDIEVHKTPADKAWWLEVQGAGTPEMKGRFVGFPGGSLNDIPEIKVEGGMLKWAWVDPKNRQDYEAKLENGKLTGKMVAAATGTTMTFSGMRAPVINEHDDGSWVKGKPIALFDGKDKSMWTGLKTPNAEGWVVEDGVLKSTGHADDLITKEKYWNYDLHVEYNIAAKSNSGVGLRGRYEVQIMDDFGRPPGLHNTGTLYTRIVPPANYGKPAGEWQTLDIRLIGTEVTGHLNGNLLYEKGNIEGLTGIAYDPYEDKPGALELQGDHGAVQFRNIILTPLTQRKK